MNTIWSFVVAHPTAFGMGSLWVFSNIVTALPSPTNGSGMFYKFAFAFAHGLAGSLPRVFPATRVFNDPTQGSGTYFQKPNGSPTTPENQSGGGD